MDRAHRAAVVRIAGLAADGVGEGGGGGLDTKDLKTGLFQHREHFI